MALISFALGLFVFVAVLYLIYRYTASLVREK